MKFQLFPHQLLLVQQRIKLPLESVTATDADGDSLTYSISGSEINISGSGVLTFASVPDYETKNSYTATVTVSDGTDSVTQAITVIYHRCGRNCS